MFELRAATTVPQRVKDRAEVLRLSHQGLYVEQIAAFFNWNERTRPGARRRWQEQDLIYLEECLREDQHTYNSQQLAQKLATERHVKLSADHLRQVLQKRG